MTDRRLTVTELSEGKFVLQGVAYEADKPNINGVTYPKEVLEKALAKYLTTPENMRLLTIGCAAKPKLRDVIGFVTDGKFVGNELHITARTLKGVAAASVAASHHNEMAFAGAGISTDMVEESGVVEGEFEITGMGVVRLNEVTPCEHKNQTKKRYPNMAKCKDCGVSICPDCDGTEVGSWGRCATCKGTGTMEEESL